LPTVFQPKVRTPLRADVAADLRAAIMSGALKAGDRVFEVEIARQMGLSRVPVREALMLLEQERLVVRHPNRGVFVTKLTGAELSEFYSLRSAIEEFAMELAMAQATERDVGRLRARIAAMRRAQERGDKPAVFAADLAFHQLVAEASRHRLLLHFWSQIATLLQAQFVTLLPVLYPLEEDIAGRHQLLLEALLGNDVEQARRLIRDHVIASGQSLATEAQRQGVIDEGNAGVPVAAALNPGLDA
jgi:DNA-binding GntR family transcriptional regulator